MKNFTLTLLLLCAFHGLAQNNDLSELNSIDTVSIETRCECLQRKYDLKREALDDFKFDENGQLTIDSALIEKRQYTFLSLKELSAKCDQLAPNTTTEPCPAEAKLTELDDEFELLLRVIEMNARPHGHY